MKKMKFKIDGDIEYRCKSCGFNSYVSQISFSEFQKLKEFECLNNIIIQYQARYFDCCIECSNGFYIEINIQQVMGTREFDCDVISDNIEINGYCDVVDEDFEVQRNSSLDLFDE